MRKQERANGAGHEAKSTVDDKAEHKSKRQKTDTKVPQPPIGVSGFPLPPPPPAGDFGPVPPPPSAPRAQPVSPPVPPKKPAIEKPKEKPKSLLDSLLGLTASWGTEKVQLKPKPKSTKSPEQPTAAAKREDSHGGKRVFTEQRVDEKARPSTMVRPSGGDCRGDARYQRNASGGFSQPLGSKAIPLEVQQILEKAEQRKKSSGRKSKWE